LFSSLSANRWGGVEVGSGSGKSGAGDKIVIGIRLPDKKKITRYEFFKKKTTDGCVSDPQFTYSAGFSQ